LIAVKSGFVAVIGWTNVGKSSLLNRFVRQKVAITSPRSQTTRESVAVILTEERGQAVFLDTPGFHRPRHLLNRMMIKEAESALGRSDLALHLVSPDVSEDSGDLARWFGRFKGPKILVVNKMDLLDRAGLMEYLESCSGGVDYDEIVPVSAITGENVHRLLDLCFTYLPEGPLLYPKEQVSDRQERFFIAEIVREKVIRLTRQELPHAVAVIIEESRFDRGKKIWLIRANIVVEKESQKGIIIGARGKMLKEIGRKARLELEEFLEGKVFLELWVKVRKNWTRDPVFLREAGYRSKNREPSGSRL
jgi:GTP-binding protein Era